MLLLLVVSGCKTNKSENQEDTSAKNRQEELYNEVISIHDEVMSKLQDISALMEELEANITNLEGSSVDDARLTTFRNQMISLDSADESMMNWMRQFSAVYDGWETDSIIEYLENEKLKIREVGEVVDRTIDRSKDLLNQ